MLCEGRDSPALFGIVGSELVFYRAVVVAVLQVVIEFGVFQHGFLRTHREQTCLLRPVVLQPEILHEVFRRWIQNGFVQRPFGGRLECGEFLQNIHLRRWCRWYGFPVLITGLQFLVVPLPARVFGESRHQGAAKAPRQHGGMYCSHGKYPFMNYCDWRDRC